MARHLVQQPRNLLSVPVFLAPAFSNIRSFSSSSTIYSSIQRGNRDKNKKRGVSVIRSTGPRHKLGGLRQGDSLPKPVADPSKAREIFAPDPDHGLWGFFNENREALVPPGEEDSFGRPWTKTELARKSWQDLHRLYWTCIKEANVVRTRNNERRRLRAGYGELEGENRLTAVKKTMFRIRQVLLERHSANFDAGILLEERNLYEIFPDLLEERVTDEHLGLNDVNDPQSTSQASDYTFPEHEAATTPEESLPAKNQSSRQRLTE